MILLKKFRRVLIVIEVFQCLTNFDFVSNKYHDYLLRPLDCSAASVLALDVVGTNLGVKTSGF